ncbi:MAG TPA: cytochrome c-type biogenesis protein [Methylomirabilota bacterium]|nr:cytochrome c-type biogenesis protein [Methylomirabilota bacterium]
MSRGSGSGARGPGAGGRGPQSGISQARSIPAFKSLTAGPGPLTPIFLLLATVLLPVLVTAQVPARSVDEQVVMEIAAQLRCVVCQNLSVADSPSETANQMRAIIRERLATGETPEQVKAYFVEKYGEWILLAPPRRGFNLLVWTLPFVGLFAGLVFLFFVARRWSRGTKTASEPVDREALERVRRELTELEP